MKAPIFACLCWIYWGRFLSLKPNIRIENQDHWNPMLPNAPLRVKYTFFTKWIPGECPSCHIYPFSKSILMHFFLKIPMISPQSSSKPPKNNQLCFCSLLIRAIPWWKQSNPFPLMWIPSMHSSFHMLKK